jgi:hypothetical protein
MRTCPWFNRLLPLSPLLALIVAVTGLLFPAAASALDVEIVNENAVHFEDDEVWVTVWANSAVFEVEDAGGAWTNDEAKRLSEIPGGKLTIDKIESGRIYVAYGKEAVHAGVPFDSPIRFDWAELTVTPAAGDKANLTAVDQFAIGMRLDTYDSSEEHLEAVSDANSETVFDALQQIPGGPQATMRDGGGNVIRVLSPLHSTAYPDLGEYVRSMSGKTIVLHSYFSSKEHPEVTSEYSGTFAADGSIALTGKSHPEGNAPETIPVPANELIPRIYTAAGTPNDLEGEILHDLFVGFSAGFWDGKYGNDALSFCTKPKSNLFGQWCEGFDQPAFGDARLSLSPFATCEQYAAVINQLADSYGNPYSDASKRVTVGLDQEGSGGKVKTLKLTILPDSGSSGPQEGGNPNCGAGAPSPAPAATGPNAPRTKVRFVPLRRAWAGKRLVKVGRVQCSATCGRVWAVLRHGRKKLAHRFFETDARKRGIVMKLTGAGKRTIAHHRRLKARIDVWVTPPGQAKRHLHRKLLVVKHRLRHER